MMRSCFEIVNRVVGDRLIRTQIISEKEEPTAHPSTPTDTLAVAAGIN